MPITIECLSENPTILIATCTGFLTIEDFKGMFEQVAKMVEGVDGQIYRVADYRQAESSFVDIMKTVQQSLKLTSGSAADPRIKTIYVGTSRWIGLARTAYQHQPGGLQIPTFHSVEDALTYIHLDVEKAEHEQADAADFDVN